MIKNLLVKPARYDPHTSFLIKKSHVDGSRSKLVEHSWKHFARMANPHVNDIGQSRKRYGHLSDGSMDRIDLDRNQAAAPFTQAIPKCRFSEISEHACEVPNSSCLLVGFSIILITSDFPLVAHISPLLGVIGIRHKPIETDMFKLFFIVSKHVYEITVFP